MSAIPVIAIFDVGKTNKKLFLFDQNYRMMYEHCATFPETTDEDGDPCENVDNLRLFVFDSLREVFRLKQYEIKAINFSAYGASFVFLDENQRTIAPLYNYLKKYPEALKKQFYDTYGGEEEFSSLTASPVLGNLNSGMQLYRLKYLKPQLFHQIKHALHLPQYLSYLVSDNLCSDITSIGCHTNLWDFQKNDYHQWVRQEGILEKLAPIVPCNEVVPAFFPGNNYSVGVGLHDSSAALIPYLVSFYDPFVLISTGTWCISLNPFNNYPLTSKELKNDCLSFLSYEGKPVKASRLFAGYEHEQQVKRITEHFNQSPGWFRSMEFNPEIINVVRKKDTLVDNGNDTDILLKNSQFGQRELSSFANEEEAYHQLIFDIVKQQYVSTQLVLTGTHARRIFVDGGFSKNSIYMNLLAAFFPGMEVFAASMAQATAVGTALAIHGSWNDKPLPNDIIELKFYSVTHDALL